MTKLCPIHPTLGNHLLEECYLLEEYLTNPVKLNFLHDWMGPSRIGLPPVYTELICINELTQYLGKAMDDLP